MRLRRTTRPRAVLGTVVAALLAAAAVAGTAAAAHASYSFGSASAAPGVVGDTVPAVTPAALPTNFTDQSTVAALPSGQDSSCPVPTAPGQMQCAAISLAGQGTLTGVQSSSSALSGYSPAQLQSAYNLTSASAQDNLINGTSAVTIAVVDAYDDPTAAADLATYRQQWGLPACDTSTEAGCVTKVNEHNQTSTLPGAPPATAGDWTFQESADLDTVSAVCPYCHILLYEANSASLADLGQAEVSAEDASDLIDNSWGSQEFFGESAEDRLYFAPTSTNTPGHAIVFPAGNNGSHTEWPAASQDVTAVGGTTLTADSSVARGYDETAWAATGSGCTTAEAKPAWQTADDTSPDGCLNRTMNDVAADADPATGVSVYDSTAYSGSAVTARTAGWNVAGGTSVASAIITSVYALNGLPKPGTYPSSYSYENNSSSNFYRVTSGTDGTCETARAYLCTAAAGYNGPAGLGTPDGVAGFVSTAVTSGNNVVTVLDPGTQDYNEGLSGVSIPVNAFDSNPAEALTYSATGLPSGLALNSSTGAITGTVPNSIATYTVKVTASDGTGSSGSVTFTIVSVYSMGAGYHATSGPWTEGTSGRCLDDESESTANGNPIDAYTCNGDTKSQDWTFHPSAIPGAGGTLTLSQDTSQCLDILNHGTANGSELQLYTCGTSSANQQWKISTGGELVNLISGRCLTDTSNGATQARRLVIEDCTGASGQRWIPTPSAVQNGAQGMCLDDANGGNSSGNKIQDYACNGYASSQDWQPHADDTFQIGGSCLDAANSSRLDGTLIQLYTCNGTATQKWLIGPNGEIENANSGKCLDNTGNTTSGIQIVQEDCYGLSGEIWEAT
jgi:hypothetical protein